MNINYYIILTLGVVALLSFFTLASLQPYPFPEQTMSEDYKKLMRKEFSCGEIYYLYVTALKTELLYPHYKGKMNLIYAEFDRVLKEKICREFQVGK